MRLLHIRDWQVMRTNIDIDDKLMRQAMRAGGTDTKKATVEAGLRLLIQTRSQVGMRRFRGKVKWEGNLEEFRRGRNTERFAHGHRGHDGLDRLSRRHSQCGNGVA